MPKFGNSSARAGKGAPKSTNKGAPKAKATHRKGAAEAAPTGRKPRHSSDSSKSRSAGSQRSFDSAPSSRPQRSSRFAADSRDSRDSRPARNARFASDSRDSRPARDGEKRREWTPEKPQRSSRLTSGRRFESDDRPKRSFDRDERTARGSRFESDSRPARKFEGDRPQRSSRFENDSRDSRGGEKRREWTPEKPQRSSRFENSDRPKRSFDRDERPARSSRFESDSRPARKFDRDDRPKRNFENGRPDRSDRVARDRDRDRAFEGARKSNPNKKAFFEDQKLERLQSVDQSTVEMAGNFADMELHPKLVDALAAMGASSPFPIQAATIPAAIGGMDVLGRGKTGSGKTVAFTVPLITKLIAGGSQPRKAGKPRALILAPTRELADQIDRTAHALAKSVGFFTACIYGGVPQRRQENMMSRGTDIVVATPGRLEDLMAQGIVDLSEVETIVIDEADHMCDLGFIEPVKRIMRATGDSQKLLFSATLDKEVDALVKEFLPAPFVYEVPNEEEDVANITHRVFTVDAEDRSQVLLRLVQGEGKSLIFARTKMTAERLSESLTAAGVPAARLHGDLNQNQRNRNLERFTKGYVRVLVATDVAARGIHVDDVALVIQVDPPEEYKTYLHRAGRTGRAGKEGTVITLIPRNRRRRMEEMLDRAERDGIFTEVRPANPILEELAGPIAPPPAQEVLDFGDSRGGGGGRGRGSREGGRGGRDGGRGGDRPRGGRSASEARSGNRGGYGKRDGGSARPNRPGKNARAKDRA
jgi:superfamily II DNA/RNA helicase